MMLVAEMTRHIQDMVSDSCDESIYQRNQTTLSVQERAFTHWCNLFLKSKGFEIDSLLDLQDGVCIIVLLEIVSGKVLYDAEIDADMEVSRNWKVILKHFENEDIDIPEFPDVTEDADKLQLLVFIIWQIILRYQIHDHYDTGSSGTKMKELDYKRASYSLLKWVSSKIPNYPISNFTTDWTDGVALCYLVNSIRPDTIPVSMFRNTNNPEINVRLACTRAEDELAIPELVAHYDIASGKVDEKSMMTYVALFRSADRMIKRGIKTKTYSSDVSMTSESESESSYEISRKAKTKSLGISYQPARCVAFGAGLRWGQVGKPAEFVVRLNGAEASDLSVSIECRPYDHRAALYKPELQIKPITETSYIVRYTPTRPGEYVLSIFCGRDHTAGSPFRLSIRETILHAKQYHDEEIIINPWSPTESLTAVNLTKCLESHSSNDSRHDSAFIDDDSLSSPDSCSPPPWLDRSSHTLFTKLSKFIQSDDGRIFAYGSGLHFGQVGLVGSFNVCTPNADKGPLSVSITCPAMSLPVPCVKTKLQPGSLLHDVLYLPTEPGIYEIDVKWGPLDVPGSPFTLAVSNTLENLETKELNISGISKMKLYRERSKYDILIYYSATTKNSKEASNCRELEILLRKEHPHDQIFSIPIDLELTTLERTRIFGAANSRCLPFVFIDKKFVGTFNDIMAVYRKGNLKHTILKRINSVKESFRALKSI